MGIVLVPNLYGSNHNWSIRKKCFKRAKWCGDKDKDIDENTHSLFSVIMNIFTQLPASYHSDTCGLQIFQ